MIEPGLVDYLLGKTAITDVVDGRIYPLLIPQEDEQRPCLVYQRISTRGIHSHNGSAQLAYARVQLTAWAATYKAARDLMELVRLALDGYAGAMGSVPVQSCLKDGDSDLMDESPGVDVLRMYGVRQDYMIGYTEAAPTL